MNPIPQFEPSFDESEAMALYDYMKSGGFVTEFRKTREFEEGLARLTGAKHCIVTNNGTISLSLALLAAGIRPGDEVLVPDLSMIATANAGTLFGAKPVFVDVEPDTLCMDLTSAKAAITSRTTALIYVSLHGRAGDMAAVRNFCQKHRLFFLEDAAQSLGSCHQGTPLGRFGDAGSFSFSMPKIITTGQGGAIVTDDTSLAEKIRRLKDFGRACGGIDLHDTVGYNFKFTDIQAVVGLEQMKKLPARIDRKRAIYRRYEERLRETSEIRMLPTDLRETTPWFIDIYVEDPDKLSLHLKKSEVGSRRLYPPMHAQKAYNSSAPCPNAIQAASRGLWIPSSVQLTDSEIDRTCEIIADCYHRSP